MEYKKINCKSYNIHTIKTDKFKTVRMEIVFEREVSKEEMPIYSFLADALSETSKEMPKRKDVAIKLEELYDAHFYSVTNKVGNLFTISFVMEFIDPAYINEKTYFEKALAFPFDVLSNPNFNNQELDIKTFNIIKKRIKEEIESIKESSERLAIINALNAMDNSSISSYRVLGSIDDIEKITPSMLYDYYLKLLNESLCDIFIIGNIDIDKCHKIITKNYKNRIIKTNKIKLLVNNALRKKVLCVQEKSNFLQSALVLIYNISNLDKKDKDITFNVFNYILGSGGISSKLYKKLRVENSLCYGVRSLYLKYDGLLIVLVTLNHSNVQKAEGLIKEAIKEMQNGSYEEDEVKDAIKNLQFSLKTSLDNNSSLLNNYIFNYYDELPLIEKRIELLDSVSKDDLIRCGKHLKLNTIYVQRSGDNNEGN